MKESTNIKGDTLNVDWLLKCRVQFYWSADVVVGNFKI